MEFKTEISGIHTRITGNTYQTTDYDQFKRLEGNREIRSIRVNKIKKSTKPNAQYPQGASTTPSWSMKSLR